MDPNPTKFPILSSLLSRLASLKFPTTQNTTAAAENGGDVELVIDHFPALTDPSLHAEITATLADVSQTRAVLRAIGDRPDHEAVDLAAAQLATADDSLSEKEKSALRSIIQLDGMHEAYENLLRDAEKKLSRIYEGSVTASVDAEVVEEVDEDVVGILRKGFGECVERVELSGRGIRFLPEAFGKLRGLVSLDLSKNQLEAVPDAIAGLECLEEFLLSSNSLTSLPDSIGLLTNLKILDVSGNKLKLLPDSICKCRSLVELNVGYNQLTYLPTNIGFEMQNLEKLWIHLNKIRSLPTSVCEMRCLRILDAQFNELRGLPLAIGKLTNLEVLNLSKNFTDLRELPASFGDLLNLRELDLSNNQISALPDTFGRLDKITKLNLDANPLVIPPTEVVNEGVEAVKEYMAKRWLDILLEEEMKSIAEKPTENDAGWLARSTSWVNKWVSGVSGSVSAFMDNGRKSVKDPYLDQEL